MQLQVAQQGAGNRVVFTCKPEGNHTATQECSSAYAGFAAPCRSMIQKILIRITIGMRDCIVTAHNA